MSDQQSLLLVANWDSGVGYAWWLMESFWITLARAYSPTHRVLLAFPSVSEVSRDLCAAPLEIVEQSFQNRGAGDLRGHIAFLRKYRVRAIYFSDFGYFDWRYPAYRMLGRVRLIVAHDHTPGMRTQPRGLKRLIKATASRMPSLTADAAIGATDFVRDRLVEVACVPPAQCFVAPNGLPAEERGAPTTDAHAAFGIDPGRQVLVMTGRAHRYKNVEFVLELLSRLSADEQAGLCFLFIGDGPDLGLFKDRASALGVAPLCVFAGRRNDVPAILRGCDLAIHPSQGEVGYSLSILEYMQAGLPVLVPDNPSVAGATVHGQTGWVYREQDVASAAEGLRTLLGNAALRRRLGETARDTVRSNYRLDQSHAGLLEAFRRVDPRFPSSALQSDAAKS